MPAESPTLGLTHLRFEALLFAAGHSGDRHDFALVAMLGLLGLRIFEATAADIADLSENTATMSFGSPARGPGSSWFRWLPAVDRAIDRAVAGRRAGSILRNSRGRRIDRHRPPAGCNTSRPRASFALPHLHPHMLGHTYVTTMLDTGVDLRDVQIAARRADPRTTIRSDRARKHLERQANYFLAAYMAAGT